MRVPWVSILRPGTATTPQSPGITPLKSACVRRIARRNQMLLDCPGSRTGCSILSLPVREGLGDHKPLDQRGSRIAVAATACQALSHRSARDLPRHQRLPPAAHPQAISLGTCPETATARTVLIRGGARIRMISVHALSSICKGLQAK